MLNPNIKIARSEGIDLPILKVYTAGRICGDHIEQCLQWQKDIINHYKYYKKDDQGNWTSYPISFLCPLNSGEGESVDDLGLKSELPPNFIWTKDILAIKEAHVIVANMEDYFEEDIKDLLSLRKSCYEVRKKEIDWEKEFFILQEKILHRRENYGTISEVGISLFLDKPVILIVPKRRKYIFENHPFMKRASVIVTSVDELLKGKWLQKLYKTIASSIYEI